MSHRRQRHLNPKKAGAVQVYDARFLTGAHNDPVATWPDRGSGGYDITASGTLRPTLKVAALNGQNCVSFDGNDALSSSPAGAAFNSLSEYLVICAVKPTSLASAPVLWVYGAGAAGQFGELGSGASVRHYWGNASTFRSYGTGNTAISTSAPSLLSWHKTASTTGSLYLSGVPQTSFTGTLGANGTTGLPFVLGAYTTVPGVPLTGDIAIYIAVPTSVSDALRKRLEHSVTRSFKLACN